MRFLVSYGRSHRPWWTSSYLTRKFQSTFVVVCICTRIHATGANFIFKSTHHQPRRPKPGFTAPSLLCLWFVDIRLGFVWQRGCDLVNLLELPREARGI